MHEQVVLLEKNLARAVKLGLPKYFDAHQSSVSIISANYATIINQFYFDATARTRVPPWRAIEAE